MKQVTERFLAKMEDTLRTYIPRLTIDGVEVEGDLQAGMTIALGSCGTEAFSIGSIFIPSISASITGCTTKLQDKELLLEMGLIMDDGEVEYLPVGYYTVEKPYTKKDVTTFTAYGRLMSKGGILYSSSLTYPTTLQNVIDEIAETMGISIVLNGLSANGIINTPIKGELCRDALKYVAGLLGGFVTEDSAGNGVISKYTLNRALVIDTDLCYEFPESNDDVYTVTGIEVIVKEEGSEEDGTTVEGEKYASNTDINVVTLNPYMNQSLFESCEANIVGFSYLPSTVRFLGDIRLEPWDSIVVMDDEEAIDVPCMNISHVWDGGLVTTITAPGATAAESDSAFKGSMSTMVEKTYLKTLVLEQLIAQKIDAEYIRTHYLEATDLHISGNSTFGGTLTAEAGGVIGGFTIGTKALHNGPSFNSMSATGNGVYLGTDGIKLGDNFKVGNSGSLSAIAASMQNLNLFDKITFFDAKGIPMHGSGNVAYSSLGTISVGDMISYTWTDETLIMSTGCMLFSMPTRINGPLSTSRLYADNHIQTGGQINAEGAILTDKGVWTGGKTTTSDGKTGGVLGTNGTLHLQSNDGNPYIAFYGKGQTGYGANISYDVESDYLHFGSASRYHFYNAILCDGGILAGGKTAYGDGLPGGLLGSNGRLYLQGDSEIPGVFFYHGGQTSAGANITYDSSTDKVNIGNSSGLTVGGTAVSLSGHEHGWTQVTATKGTITTIGGYCAYNTAINLAIIRMSATITPTADVAAGTAITIATLSGNIVPNYLNALSVYTGSTNTRRWHAAITSDGNIIARPSTALTKGTEYVVYIGGAYPVTV